MSDPDSSRGRPDLVILLLLLALFLFFSPLAAWWARAELHWLVPFFLWALLIGLVAAYDRYEGDDDA
jgi:peptidoglycan/LPS O-acetylase OafA/YrhL